MSDERCAESGAEAAYRGLVEAGVDLIVTVPDSMLGPLDLVASRRPEIRYIQACDEATAFAIGAGAWLAGTRSLVVMENSGLRRGCETLSRLTLAHRLHAALLLSHRGAFGEPNWWGVAHSNTMHTHLDMLGIPFTEVRALPELGPALTRAYAMLATGQCSVGVIAHPDFCSELGIPR